MKNKGLTIIELVVLLVVIAGIGILLFPIISDYIIKSRLHADMDMAKKLATAMQEVLLDKNISENAVEHATPQLVSDMDGRDFKKAVYEKLELEIIEGKSQKNADGEEFGVAEFYYTLNSEKNRVEIYYGGITEEFQIYPKTGQKLIK